MQSINKKLKNELYQKFNGKCAYCGVHVTSPSIDHFVPKYLSKDLSVDINNLIMSCATCNAHKSNQFPESEDGEPLLLHPIFDNWKDHIIELDNGYLQGITHQGEATIETLRLNRPNLVEIRVARAMGLNLESQKNPSEHDVCMTFKESMRSVDNLSDVQVSGDLSLQTRMWYMLYGNVITSLETYLCDRFLSLVEESKEHFKSFVQTFHDFKTRKFTLSEFYSASESLEAQVIESIKSVLYHDLPKVSGMYRDTFKIEFPPFGEIYKVCTIRHDVVHRGGKTKDGKFHLINANTIKKAVNDCMIFVEELEKELSEIQ
ncbi:HNH endonuclease [Pantoea ananatis]|uniref:HNH endonuclease n=1 Tax=Pantoea ananas TaxID=553 RepID=UPI001B31843B|nr:HNH endonuclease [Pantoea ananatis]